MTAVLWTLWLAVVALSWYAGQRIAEWLAVHGVTSVFTETKVQMSEKLGPTGWFPRGKADPSDEGQIQIAIAADPKAGIVRVLFGKPIAWLGISPKQARVIAQNLIKHADELEGKG